MMQVLQLRLGRWPAADEVISVEANFLVVVPLSLNAKRKSRKKTWQSQQQASVAHST